MKKNPLSPKTEHLNPSDLTSALQVLQDAGMISSSGVEKIMNEHYKQVLSQHKFSIKKGKDGRWVTQVKDDTKKDGRRKIRKPTKEQVYEELYNTYTEQNRENQLSKITLDSLFPKWVEDKKDEVSPLTIERYMSDYRRFYQDTDLIKIPLRDLDKVAIKKWAKNAVKEHHLTRKQFRNMAVIINQTLDFAVDEGIIDSNPYLSISFKRHKYFAKEIPKLNEEEVFVGDEKKMLEKLAMEEYYAGTKKYEYAPLAVIFQKRTSMRVGEVCALRYEDLAGDYINVRRFYSKNRRMVIESTKGTFGPRPVPLDAKAKEILAIIEADRKERGIPLEGYIFTTNGKPMSYDAMRDSLKKYCALMGTINKSTHTLRKTGMTDWLDAGISPSTIQKWAGHKTPEVFYNSYLRDTTAEEERLKKLNNIP